MSETGTASDLAGHDSQRAFEQRALRNVRGLVDRMQGDEEAKQRSQKWVVGVLVAIVVALAAVVVVTVNRKPAGTQEIVVPPVTKAPAR